MEDARVLKSLTTSLLPNQLIWDRHRFLVTLHCRTTKYEAKKPSLTTWRTSNVLIHPAALSLMQSSEARGTVKIWRII